MCAEISTKLMREETVYDILRNHRERARGDWTSQFMNEILGSTVLTRYNNRTYRIDDVDFQKNPESTFTTPQGERSYVDYYQAVSALQLEDNYIKVFKYELFSPFSEIQYHHKG